MVDAGHGGTDNGAVAANGLFEKDINLSIAKKIEQLAPEYGITVKMVRTKDITLNPQERLDAVLAGHFDAYISVHVQTTEEKTTDKNAMDVFITRFNSNTNFARSRLLGSSIIKTLESNFDVDHSLQQRKEKGIYVIDANPFPAILIECGFMNSITSIKQLTDDSKEQEMAKGILQGVVAYANADKNDMVSASVKNESVPDVSSSLDTSGKKTPLYLVNGKETSVADAQKIDANTIQSVNVIKGDEAAVKKYGAKAGNGVVLITLKAHAGTEWIDAADGKTPQSPLTIKTQLDSILIVLDGKVIDSKELSLMSPNDIESINVLKDEATVEKYGEKGRNGVIEIKLKKVKSPLYDSSAVNNIRSEYKAD